MSPKGQANDFIHWVQLLNDAMRERGAALIEELKAVDAPILIHAHDWLAHYAASALKHQFQLPLVATIHATENGRNNGINGPTQEYINSVEWNLQNEAWRVIVCTEFMKRECARALHTPWDKMDIIYNGVDPAKFVVPEFSGSGEGGLPCEVPRSAGRENSLFCWQDGPGKGRADPD